MDANETQHAARRDRRYITGVISGFILAIGLSFAAVDFWKDDQVENKQDQIGIRDDTIQQRNETIRQLQAKITQFGSFVTLGGEEIAFVTTCPPGQGDPVVLYQMTGHDQIRTWTIQLGEGCVAAYGGSATDNVPQGGYVVVGGPQNVEASAYDGFVVVAREARAKELLCREIQGVVPPEKEDQLIVTEFGRRSSYGEICMDYPRS